MVASTPWLCGMHWSARVKSSGGISAHRKPRIGFFPRTFLRTYAAPPLQPFLHNHPVKITPIFAAPQYTPCN
ncbi:hypothetical protein C8R44DRAFT_822844, partial [Mycena epipterygia]